MSVVNLSLPEEQVILVDQMVISYGFANRSEFIRSLIRFIGSKPTLIEKASVFPFIYPVNRSSKQILADFKKTGKYSTVFLKDLADGLRSSNYFMK